jgi:hypothetical protein
MTEPVWKKYLTDYNEGLGVVYERFVLNEYLEQLVDEYGIRSVLEAPLYGMAGVSGINSVQLAQRGCDVTLVDCLEERLNGVARIWRELELPAHFVLHQPLIWPGSGLGCGTCLTLRPFCVNWPVLAAGWSLWRCPTAFRWAI